LSIFQTNKLVEKIDKVNGGLAVSGAFFGVRSDLRVERRILT
jgi:hypothetical protein